MMTTPPRIHPSRRTRVTAWLASLILILGTAPVFTFAQDAKPDGKRSERKDAEKKEPADKADAKFKVQALAINATKKNTDVDKELKSMAKSLTDRLAGYTGFKLLKRATGSVAASEEFAADLPSDFKIKITPESRDGDTIKLRVKISSPGEKDKSREKPKSDDKDAGTRIEIKAGTSQLFTFKHPDDKEDKYVIAVSAK